MKIDLRFAVRYAIPLLAAFCLAAPLGAQTWDGGGAGGGIVTWSSPANWNPDGVPLNNGTAAITMAGTIDTTNTLDINFDINSLSFNNTAGAFVLNNSGGASLTIRGGGIINLDAQTQTINLPIVLGAAQTWNALSGPLSFGGPLGLTLGTHQLSISGGFNTTMSNVIQNTAGSLVKNGAGVLTLNGTNLHSGGTTLNAGTLAIGNNAALGSGALSVNGGAIEASGANRTLNNPVTVNGTFTVGRSLGLAELTLSGPMTLTGNDTVTVNDSVPQTFSGSISGSSQQLIKAGTGSLVLSGFVANTFGGAAVNDGALVLNKQGGVIAALAGNTFVGDGGGTANSAELRLMAADQITDTSAVTVRRDGHFNLNGFSDVIGPLTVDGITAAVTIGSGSTLNASSLTFTETDNTASGTINVGSGTLSLGGTLTTNGLLGLGEILGGTLSLQGATRTFDIGLSVNQQSLTISSAVTSGTINKTGTGTLALSGFTANTAGLAVSAGLVQLIKTTAGVNAVAGSLSISGGTVELYDDDQIADGTSIAVSGTGTLDLNNHSDTVGALNFTGGTITSNTLGGSSTLTITGNVISNASAISANIFQNLNLGGATRTFTVADGGAAVDLDISAVVDNGGISKDGTGTMRLGGGFNPNSYTGTTTVNAGTLLLASAAPDVQPSPTGLAMNGNLIIQSAATVRLERDNQISKNAGTTVTLNGGLLDLNNNDDDILNLTVSGGNILTGTGVLTVEGAVTSSAASTGTTISGNLGLGGGTRTFNIVESAVVGTEMTVSAAISNGGVTKIGLGVLLLSGSAANSYTGDTTVNQGILLLNKSGGAVAVAGNVIIGDGIGFANADVLRLQASGQLAEGLSRNVTVNSTGLFDLNGFSYSADGSVLVNGSIATGAGTLTIATGGSYTQNAGSNFSGTLVTNGAFIYNGGTFGGRLIQNLTATFNADFTAGNGAQNLFAMNAPTGRTLTFNGAGLDSQGVLTLTGGTITGSGPLANSGLISGHGTIAGSGGFTNTGALNLTDIHLTLSNTGANYNSGTIDVPLALQLRLAGGNLTNTGRITLSGGTITGTATLINQAGGEIAGGSSVLVPLTNGGGLIHATGTGVLTIANLSGGNTSGGELRVDDGATLTVQNNFVSSGTIVLAGANSIFNGGAVTNTGTVRGQGRINSIVANSGAVRAEGGTLTLVAAGNTNTATGRIESPTGTQVLYAQGLATNSGQIALTGGAFDNNNLPLANPGRIEGYGTVRTGGLTNTGAISVAGSLDVLGGVTQNATVSTQSGATVRFFGPVSGPGSYTGAGTVMFLSTFSPGASPAAVSFGGDLAFAGSSTLFIELAGTTPGSQYDTLSIAGAASLDGILNVSLIDGFAPGIGDSFEIAHANSGIFGTFAATTLPALDAGLDWNVVYSNFSVLLQIAAAGLSGDYNQNGVVDAADYVVWRKNDGSPDGYSTWRANFGRTAGSGPALGSSPHASVPEPATWGMFLVVMLVMSFRRASA